MKYKYKIFGQDTKLHEGYIDDVSRDNVISKLQAGGNIIVEVEETLISEEYTTLDKFKKNITKKDLVLATRQLSTLIGGGVQILRAVRLLSSEATSVGLGERFKVIGDDLQSGMQVYKAFSRHGDIFDQFYISMVHSGEETGKLKESFEYLADYIERNYELIQKTKKALTYPIFVIITFFAVMMIMSLFVLPKLVSLIVEQGQELPWFTAIMIDASNFIKEYYFAIIPSIFGMAYYFIQFGRTPAGRAYYDTVKLKMPLIGSLYNKLFLSRFADNIDTMISSGVPIVQALQITAEVVDNYVYKKMFERVAERVKQGVTLSKTLSEEPLIPNIMVQMARIGEETGELGYMLKNVATFYKRELERTIESTIALVEPIMIVALGGGVGLLMASVLLPMYNIASSIQ
jgi:type II secretory pathway component PulF